MSGDPGAEPLQPTREGSLAELDLVRLLAEIAREGMTGIFRAVRDGAVIEVCFLDGRIADALSNDPAHSLERSLRRGGGVEDRQLRLAAETREDGEGLCDRLVSLGYLSPEKAVEVQQRQVLGIAAELLSWGEGTWRWYARRPAREVRRVGIRPEQVLVDRARALGGEAEENLEEIGGEEARWRLPKESLGLLAALDLPEVCDLLCLRLDGSKTVGDVVGEGLLSPEEATAFLRILMILGWIEREASAAPRASEQAAVSTAREGQETGSSSDAPGADRAAAIRERKQPPEEGREVREEPRRDAMPPPEPAVAREDPEEEEKSALVEEVMRRGTLIEVLFSLALLAAVFTGVLYLGRHYLAGLREDLDETRLTRAVPAERSAQIHVAKALPPGSARRILGEVEFRLLDREPPPERVRSGPGVDALYRRPEYRRGLEEFRVGNYGRAAEIWARLAEGASRAGWTWRIGRACRPEEIRSMTRKVGDGFFLLEELDGDCFLVLWGLFEERETAAGLPPPGSEEPELESLGRLVG